MSDEACFPCNIPETSPAYVHSNCKIQNKKVMIKDPHFVFGLLNEESIVGSK